MSLLVICKPLLLFVKSLPADAKDIGGNSDNLSQPIQTELAKKQKYFCNYLAAFLKFTFYLITWKNKMTLIAYVFPELKTGKNFV